MTTIEIAAVRRALRLLALLGALLPSTAWSATFQVNSTEDAPDATIGDGVCETVPGNGVCTLRAALLETNALPGPDTIRVPAGTYRVTRLGGGDAEGSFNIRDHVTIEGAGADNTFIDGARQDTVFEISGASKTVLIADLTIQNGSTSRFGGGINAILDNQVTLRNVVVRDNSAAEGAGIFNQGQLTLERSVVYGNATIADGVFRRGGGIYNSTGTLTLRESTVRDNSAASGGGIFSFATVLIDRSTISGNTATNGTLKGGEGGGGIVSAQGFVPSLVVATNSTISGNLANSHYGGLYIAGGSAVLSSVTIANNRADANGDGFGNGGGIGLSNTAAATLRNTIVAANAAAGLAKDCFSLNASGIASAGFNLVGAAGADCAFVPGVGDQVGDTASPIDAGLQPLADNGGPTFTHALGEASPAIDAGDPNGCSDGTDLLTVDQRGAPRPGGNASDGARCDIGAYEVSRPIADAGSDKRVNANTVVTLDGSNSVAAGGIRSFRWTQVAGAAVSLAGADSATPSFTAPSAGGVLTFELTVTDAFGASASDEVNVSVNAAPIAQAGADQTVAAGATVQLNASASSDADGTILSYLWLQTGGVPVALVGADTATPSFVAPTSAATLTFEATVTDNEGAAHSDSVTVTVTAESSGNNKPPVAKAGPDRKKKPHALVVLSGWKSYDPDGRIVAYRWTQVGGPRVHLYGSRWPWAVFVAPKADAVLTFELTVTDNKGARSTDRVSIEVDYCERSWFDRLFGWLKPKHKHKHACRR